MKSLNEEKLQESYWWKENLDVEHQKALDKFKKNKDEYVLPPHINEKLTTNLKNIKTIFKDAPEAREYLLKQILLSYTNNNINVEIGYWIQNQYYKKIDMDSYCDLLKANTALSALVKGNDVTILYDTPNLDTPLQYQIQNQIIHEYIRLSELPYDEIATLGDVYMDFI